MRLDVKLRDRQVRDLLVGIQKRGRDLRPALEVIGEAVQDSVQENFRAGGRPTPWKKSKRVEAGLKLPGGEGQTLVDTGALRDSITYEADDRKVVIGTNKPQAAIHHFGGTIKAHTVKPKRGKFLAIPTADGVIYRTKANIPAITMPARPFLMVQDKDWDTIVADLEDYVIRGEHG